MIGKATASHDASGRDGSIQRDSGVHSHRRIHKHHRNGSMYYDTDVSFTSTHHGRVKDSDEEERYNNGSDVNDASTSSLESLIEDDSLIEHLFYRNSSLNNNLSFNRP